MALLAALTAPALRRQCDQVPKAAPRQATVVAMVADGMTTDEILAEHPDLTPADIHESLLYAAEALQERELPLRRTA